MPAQWEQQTGEGNQAYQAFAAFRDLGPDRTCADAARKVGKNRTLIERWSRSKDWVNRALAFDRWNEQLVLSARAKERERQAKEWQRRRLADLEADHTLGTVAKTKAREAFDLIERNTLSPADAVKLARLGVDLTRESRDDAMADPEWDSFDPATASPEELRAFVDRHKARRAANDS